MSSSGLGFGFRQFQRASLRTLPSSLHWIYLLFAVPQVIFLALCMPPFMNADEPAHFDRASQVAHLQLGASFGGDADTGADNVYIPVNRIPFNPAEHYTAAERAASEGATWTGRFTWRPFPNTGTCPFTGYLPQALGIVIGKAIGLSPFRTLVLARLLNGAFAIAICSFALYWSRGGRLFMFALLMMPMTLSLFASCGQDATLVALTCLAFALISRQLDLGVPLSRVQLAVVIVSLLIVIVGRPPYIVFALVLLAPGLVEKWRDQPSWLPGLCFAALSFAITVAWWLTALRSTRAIAKPFAGIGVVDAKLQLANLLHHPAIARDLFAYIIHHIPEYFAGVIGYLGWLDTTMPTPYYLMMIAVLALAVIAETSAAPQLPKNVSAAFLFAGLAGIAVVFLIEYLIWTPVGAPGIYGVQGRYFIPIVIAAAVGLPRLQDSGKTYERATAIVVAVQLITVVVLPHVILARYYGG